MNGIKHYLFDLDGTISDSKEGVVNSFIFALKQMKLYSGETSSEMSWVVGPPLRSSFEKYGLTGDDLEKAVREYRKYFSKRGIFENEIYPGIADLLKQLKSGGGKLYIATCKPTVYSKKIIENYGIGGLFTCVAGAFLNGRRDKKHEVIEYLMKKYKMNPAETLMIGDTLHDIKGARQCGIKVAAVSYGCGRPDEIKTADFVASTVDELRRILI